MPKRSGASSRAAAAEEKAVHRVERLVEMAAVDARKRQGHAPGERDGPLVADAGVVAEVVEADREADDGFSPARHCWTFLPESA